MKLISRMPKLSFNSQQIKIRAAQDHVGQYHFRPAPLTPLASARFEYIQKAVLAGSLVFSSAQASLGASLVLFDGIATMQDLRLALAQAGNAYLWQENVCIEWKDTVGRCNRSKLSSFSRAALAHPQASAIDTAATISTLDSDLRKGVAGNSTCYTLEILLLDAQAWLFENLPGPLLAHCLNLAPITSLPRSVLVRETKKMALILEATAPDKSEGESGLALALSGYWDSTESENGASLVAELVKKCRWDRSKSAPENNRRMLKDALGAAQRASDCSKTVALIIAWIVDLIESGTRGKPIIRPNTIAKYVRSAAFPLLTKFRKRPLEELDAATIVQTYRQMMEGLTSSQRRTLASALHSWHHFVSCWLEVEPLSTSLHRWIPASPPKANLFWPHELALAGKWLDAAHGDDRLLGQLRVALAIARCIRIRTAELLLGLRLKNFRFFDNRLEIEICPRPSDTSMKTPAARRYQEVADPSAITQIREWLARRQAEGALQEDYMFGDPYRPNQRYRIGQTYLWLQRLLKAVSGDPEITVHALSHTHISFGLRKAADTDPEADINPFDSCAAGDGHESVSTGFSSYFHFPEEWLRTQLDRAIGEQLSWGAIRSHVGLKHDAFRQFRCRARSKTPDIHDGQIALAAIARACPSPLLPQVWEGFQATDPQCPDFTEREAQLTLFSALDILTDIAAGIPMTEVAARSMRTPAFLDSLAGNALLLLEYLGESRRRLHSENTYQTSIELQSELAGTAGPRLQFKRTGQPKLAYLAGFLQDMFDTPSAGKGIYAWRNCYRRGYLTLDKPAQAAGLIEMLDAAGVPRDLLLVRFSRGTSGSPQHSSIHKDSLAEKRLRDDILSIFSKDSAVPPAWDEITYRSGRPRAYLVILSGSAHRFRGRELPCAMAGMGGFNALLFAASVLSMSATLPASNYPIDAHPNV